MKKETSTKHKPANGNNAPVSRSNFKFSAQDIDKIIEANELIENIKTAILGSTIITIRNSETNEFLWSCHTGESYGAFKDMKIEVDQDIHLTAILREMKIYLERGGEI